MMVHGLGEASMAVLGGGRIGCTISFGWACDVGRDGCTLSFGWACVGGGEK